MKRKLVIFGAEDSALLAHRYFQSDSEYEVAAFTVDRAYLSGDSFCDLPLVPFEDVSAAFDPSGHEMFVALGYSQLNALRKNKYLAAKAMSYRLASYISSRATILNDMAIGENCFVLEDNTVQPFAVIGDNVTLWSGNHIGHHTIIRDHCFLASHVVVAGHVDVGESCFIGINVTIRDHVKVGERCVLGAGAAIYSDAAPEGVYNGVQSERSRVPSSRLRKI